MSEELKPCPCGFIPKTLSVIDANQGGKYATAEGGCCGWTVEFRTQYNRTETPECMSLAVEAWNEMPRALSWIPCAERLPEGEDGFYKCLIGNSESEYAEVGMFNQKLKLFQYLDFDINSRVTHWMPFPSLPESKVHSAKYRQCDLCGSMSYSALVDAGDACMKEQPNGRACQGIFGPSIALFPPEIIRGQDNDRG